jgi:hypothetical protein
MTKEKIVTVLDPSNCFQSCTSPAKARKLLKAGKASVFNANPFTIKMKGDGELSMPKKTLKKPSFLGSYQTNWTNFFAQDKDVYVQNLGSTNIQLEFRGPNGNIYVLIPKTRKPLNLTQHVPFDMLASNPDFRKVINRNPPILRLMTEEEFIQYYEDIATQYGTSVEEEIRKGQDLQDALMNRRRPANVELQAEMDRKIEEKEAKLLKVEEPNARTVGLCAQADKENGAARLSEREFLEELEMLTGTLTVNDWEFVASKGVYKGVKKFALAQIDKLTTSDDE